MIYSAIEFIDDAIEKQGGKVYVHCHQGVSRSSSSKHTRARGLSNLGRDEHAQRLSIGASGWRAVLADSSRVLGPSRPLSLSLALARA